MLENDMLYRAPKGVQTRWASPENWGAEKGGACKNNDGRKRRASFWLKVGESRTLADVTGASGVLRRIWMTIRDRSPAMLRGLRLDIFWDGAAKAAVSAPLGDFFMHGLGKMATFQNALFASPEGRSFVSYVPMPFRTGAKVIITNEANADAWIYFDVNLTIGDEVCDDDLYFHACWRRENPTVVRQDYQILPKVTGRGRFLGSNVSVSANKERYFDSWWGEGEIKVFLDGDTGNPTLCGTGTEDYIGTGWGQGQYAQAYHGCHFADKEKKQYCFYRLHIPDPIYFAKDIMVTMQQIGWTDADGIARMHGYGRQLELGAIPFDMERLIREKQSTIFERADDWSSCAYFYLDRPESELPDLCPCAERTSGLA